MPQFAGSVILSEQLLPHGCTPPAQVSEHVPSEQTLPVGQALPHVPQLAPSVIVFTQPVPHAFKRPVHWQAPLEQLCPLAHALPHMPQFRLSVVVSEHAVPHMSLGALQVALPPPVPMPVPPLPGLSVFPELQLAATINNKNVPNSPT